MGHRWTVRSVPQPGPAVLLSGRRAADRQRPALADPAAPSRCRHGGVEAARPGAAPLFHRRHPVVIYASIAAYCGLGLILGIRHAVLPAIMTGFLEMIPVIGPLTSAVVAGLVAVRYATGIGNLIGYAVYATVLRLS